MNKVLPYTPLMVWHYAPWAYLPSMVESGVLRVGNASAPGEKPLLWFSTNQKWDATAAKIVRTNTGTPRFLTFKEQEKVLGCIRFGLATDDSRLLNWIDACSAAGTPRETRRQMERVGKKKGADSAHWFATAVSIPLNELHFQVWVGRSRYAE